MKKRIKKFLYRFSDKFKEFKLDSRGEDTRIPYTCTLEGNISIGNHCSLGIHNIFLATRSKIIVGDYVIFGPHVTLVAGDHQINIVGKRIAQVTDQEKDSNCDRDIIIEDDCWLGANVTVLKGVTIKEGCVIGAGSVVTKSTEPYGVYIGVPARKVKNRFTEEELIKHKEILGISEK